MRQLTRVAIGLGSNLGDREASLRQAMARLVDEFVQSPVVSSIYESPPWGPIRDQGPFLNAVLVGESEWKPPGILNYLKLLERELGREPGPKYGPRVIDLDLLAYGEKAWEADGLIVPHPRMAERDFVCLPLAEAWPGWRHPGTGKTVEEMCRELAAKGAVTARVVGK